MVLVGLPDTALREARDRIRSAIVFPVKLTC
jgi:predicted ATPase with chaperone activity